MNNFIIGNLTEKPSSQMSVMLINAGFSDGGDQFKRYIDEIFGQLPKNSRKALVSDLGIYTKFCKDNNMPVTSADTVEMTKSLTAFIAYQATKVKANTLNRRIASLRSMFSVMNVPNPLANDKILMLNIKYTLERISAPSSQAKPMDNNALTLALSQFNLEKVIQLRAAVIISLAYDTMARASELQQIQLHHFTKNNNGTARMLIERSKTDKTAIGSYRFVSVSSMKLIDKWITKCGITEGYLFKAVNANSNNVCTKLVDNVEQPISYNTILRAYKLVGDDKLFSAHSTRVGSTLDQIAADIPGHKIQIAGGWKSSTMVTYYGRMLESEDSGSAQMAKILGR